MRKLTERVVWDRRVVDVLSTFDRAAVAGASILLHLPATGVGLVRSFLQQLNESLRAWRRARGGVFYRRVGNACPCTGESRLSRMRDAVGK